MSDGLAPGLHRVRVSVTPTPGTPTAMAGAGIAQAQVLLPPKISFDFSVFASLPGDSFSPGAMAVAGPDLTVIAGQSVSPITSPEIPDVQLSSLAWHLVAPTGSRAVLQNASTLRPVLVTDVPGTYRLVLRATVAGTLLITDEMRVFALAPGANRIPSLAVTAPEAAVVGQPLQVAVVAADPDGDPITLSYEVLPTAAVTYGSSSAATIVFPGAGPHLLTVTASDGRGGAATSQHAILVTDPSSDGGVDAESPATDGSAMPPPDAGTMPDAGGAAAAAPDARGRAGGRGRSQK